MSKNKSSKWDLIDGTIALDTKLSPTKDLSISSKDNNLTAIISGASVRIFNNSTEAEPVIINANNIIICFI